MAIGADLNLVSIAFVVLGIGAVVLALAPQAASAAAPCALAVALYDRRDLAAG